MKYILAVITVVLLAFAALVASEGSPWWSFMFGLGAALALVALKSDLSRNMVVFLAVTATVTMFIYFAGFFFLAPYLHHDALAPESRNAFGLLLAGFSMKPVIATFSCRMKADLNHDEMCAFYRARRRAQAARQHAQRAGYA